MGEVTFARESLAQVRASGVEQLLAVHYREIAHFPDIALDPDWKKYEDIERAGRYRLFTAREGKELIGYATYIVATNPHYKSSLQAVQDVLFLRPERRGLLIGSRLIAYADRELAGEGVQVVYHHAKAAHPLDAVLPSADTESIHDTAEYLDDLFVPTSLGGGATGAWANTIGFLYQYDRDSASTTVSITTTESSTTVSASTAAVAAMWVGEFIDGPTSTTGLPAGDYVTSTDSSAGTFTVETAAETSGTYSVTCGTYGPSSQYQGSAWMVQYQVVALSYIADLGIEGLSNQSTLQTVRDFSYLNTVPYMAYGSSASWQFPSGANYNMAYLGNFTTFTSATPDFLTVAQQWAALLGNSDITAYTATAGQDLYDHNTTSVMTAGDSSNLATGYWGGMLGPLAYATDAGYSGASTAWATLTGAANYTPNGGTAPTTANDSPQFSIVPRTAQ